jgi:hypothetical protein
MKTVCQMMYDVCKGPKLAMQDRAYQKAQQAYDRMEHPDYWEDSEEEFNDALERKIMQAEFRRDSKREEEMFEGKNFYDPLEAADLRRKEIKENELMRGVK